MIWRYLISNCVSHRYSNFECVPHAYGMLAYPIMISAKIKSFAFTNAYAVGNFPIRKRLTSRHNDILALDGDDLRSLSMRKDES